MKDFFKKLFSKGGCPDCGWLIACQECSERYDAIDKELKDKCQ